MTSDTAMPQTQSTPAVDAAGAALASRNRMALILLLAAVFVVFLNETMMSVALPKIQEALGIDATQGQWLTTAFALTMAVVIPITGWLMQRLNTRPVFIMAMSTFSVGTLIAALSPVFEALIVGRVVQAIGTAIMMPLMMTTVMTIVAPHERGRIMGRISVVMSVAPALGPVVSGALLQVLPWQGLFWVMLPIAVAMLLIGMKWVPNVSETRSVPLDVPSVILSALAFSTLVYGLSSIGTAAIGTAPVAPWVPITIGVLLHGRLRLAPAGAAAHRFRAARPAHLHLAQLHAVGRAARDRDAGALRHHHRAAAVRSVHPRTRHPVGRCASAPRRTPDGSARSDRRSAVRQGRAASAHHPGCHRRVHRAVDHGVRAGRGLVVGRPARSRYITLCLGLAFLFTPLFSTSLGSLQPQAVLVRQRDGRDPAAGGRCRRHGGVRGALRDRARCRGQPRPRAPVGRGGGERVRTWRSSPAASSRWS